MTPNDDRLRELLRESCEQEPIPPFEATWRRAERAAAERRTRSAAWRWVLGPAVAVGAAAAVLLVLSALGPERGTPLDAEALVARADAGAAAQLLADLADLEIGELPSDELIDDGTVAAALEGDPLAGGTDFLLTLELPAWDAAGERKSL